MAPVNDIPIAPFLEDTNMTHKFAPLAGSLATLAALAALLGVASSAYGSDKSVNPTDRPDPAARQEATVLVVEMPNQDAFAAAEGPNCKSSENPQCPGTCSISCPVSKKALCSPGKLVNCNDLVGQCMCAAPWCRCE